MSRNVNDVLDAQDRTAMILQYGYNWRENLARQIHTEWQKLPWIKRLYWTLRGARPV